MEKLLIARSDNDFQTARILFREYAEWLGFRLDYQNFDQELNDIHLQYGPPDGALILVVGETVPAGCVGIRKNEEGIAELKRMYLRDVFRGKGLGKAMLQEAIIKARKLGYERIRLDTLPSMSSANALYESLGFVDIPAYRYNPFQEARFMELIL